MAQQLPFRLSLPASARADFLEGFIDHPSNPGPWPTVIICHGFKGFMEWGFFSALAHLLAERGFAAVRFNFSGAGQRPGEDRVSDLAAFEANTFSREGEELGTVLDAVGGGGLEVERGVFGPGQFDVERIGLFGHSRGGGAVLQVADDPRVRSVVTWAGVSTYQRWNDEQKEQWRKAGGFPVMNGRTGQELTLGLGLLDDIEQNADALDLEAAAERREAPWLIVHGGNDETVPIEEAETLYAAAREPRELLQVQDAGHTFGAKHPFQGPTPHLIEAMNATQDWFRKTLA